MQQQSLAQEDGNTRVYPDGVHADHQVSALDRTLDQDCQGEAGGATEAEELSSPSQIHLGGCQWTGWCSLMLWVSPHTDYNQQCSDDETNKKLQCLQDCYRKNDNIQTFNVTVQL